MHAGIPVFFWVMDKLQDYFVQEKSDKHAPDPDFQNIL